MAMPPCRSAAVVVSVLAIVLSGCSSDPGDPGVLRWDDVPGSTDEISPRELSDPGQCAALIGPTVKMSSDEASEFREFTTADGDTVASSLLAVPKWYGSPDAALESIEDAARECVTRKPYGGGSFEFLDSLPSGAVGYRSTAALLQDADVITRVFAPVEDRIVVLTTEHDGEVDASVDVMDLLPTAIERAVAAS